LGTIFDDKQFKIDKMKKIVLFIAFIMTGLFLQAQDTQMERAQAKEMDHLVKIVTYEHKNLAFNKNQTTKLEQLFLQKSIELVELRNDKDIAKGDYMKSYQSIQDKYEPKVEAILSPTQKIAYRKNAKKQIKKLID
jgi:hypothetical protein